MRRLTLLIALSALLLAPARAADIDSLERQLLEARDAAPMVIKPFLAVKKSAEYFGDYEPRASTVYNRSEPLIFYGEPKNLMYPKNSKGQYEPAFDVDVEIRAPDGNTMKKDKFITFKLPTRSRAQDLFLNLTLTLNQAPPGKYNVKFTVRDKNSKKFAAVESDVTLK